MSNKVDSEVKAMAASTVLYSESYTPCWAFLYFFLPCFMKYSITCTSERLRVGYRWPVFKNIPISDLLSCELIPELGLLKWGGYGCKRNFNGLGYIAEAGAGVKIISKKGTLLTDTFTLYFSCRDPEALIKILTSNGVHHVVR
jgi:hypothetical protein